MTLKGDSVPHPLTLLQQEDHRMRLSSELRVSTCPQRQPKIIKLNEKHEKPSYSCTGQCSWLPSQPSDWRHNYFVVWKKDYAITDQNIQKQTWIIHNDFWKEQRRRMPMLLSPVEVFYRDFTLCDFIGLRRLLQTKNLLACRSFVCLHNSKICAEVGRRKPKHKHGHI